MEEPLIAGGVRCHGGFAEDGTYVSPRTKFRVPAIEAWRAHHARGLRPAGHRRARWSCGASTSPTSTRRASSFGAGVPEPLIATLTRIGTVEGYGANIRLLKPSNLQRFFDEDIPAPPSTTWAAGSSRPTGATRRVGGRGGHKDMWFAARDIAFESQAADVDIEGMLTPHGLRPAGEGRSEVARLLPDDVDPELEMMAALMIRVLFIEVSAFHTFRWAEAWLSDPDLVAGDGAAGRLVTYIRADETPHVALPRDRPDRDARPDLGRRGRQDATGAEMIGTPVGPAAPAEPRARPRAGSQGRDGRGRALVPARARAAPTSWPSSTRSGPA